MKVEFYEQGQAIVLNIFGNWFLSIYFDMRHWGFDYHFKAPCCKFWLDIGPFEINRIWAESDEYPFKDE